MLDLIPDPRTMSYSGMVFFLAVYHVLWIIGLVWLMGKWFGRQLRLGIEAACDETMKENGRLKAKLREYERTHRTMV